MQQLWSRVLSGLARSTTQVHYDPLHNVPFKHHLTVWPTRLKPALWRGPREQVLES